MGMWFFGGGVGHKSTHAAIDHFLEDHNHSDLDIDRQHDSFDALMDQEDEAAQADSPVVEGTVLSGDNDYGYGDPLALDELEDIVSDPEDNNSSSEKDGANPSQDH